MKKHVVLIAAAVAAAASVGGLGVYSIWLDQPVAQAMNVTQLSTGQKYLAELNYTEAVSVLEHVIEVEPKNAEAYLSLSKAYKYMGDTDAAEDVLKKGVENSGSKLLEDELARLSAPAVQQPDTSGDDAGTQARYVTIGGRRFRSDVKELILRGCGLTDADLASLAEFTSLELLDISNNGVTDISALSGVTTLKKFYAANNQIADVSPLKELPELEYVGLRGNRISDGSVLFSKSGLIYLHLADNNLTGVSAPADSIELLYLEGNGIKDVSVIRNSDLLYCDIL